MTSRTEELKRKFRPETFRTEVCRFCLEAPIDPLAHVCDPVKLADCEREREFWKDPWAGARNGVLAELRPQIVEVVRTQLGGEYPEMVDNILKVVTPYLDTGGPVG